MVLNNIIANDYLRGLIVFLFFLIVLRVLFSIVQRVFVKVTSKTKTDLDDIILAKISAPITFLVTMISINLGFLEIQLEEKMHLVVSNIIYSISFISVAYIIYSIIDIVLLRLWRKISLKSKINIDESLTSIVHSIVKIILIILAVLYILQLWGVEIGPLLAGLGIAGLAVALALQPTLSNIFSGVSIVLDKSVRVGDLVYLDADTKGTILKIGIRSTKIKTFDNELIIIPNSKLADSKIQNVAQPEPKSRAVVPFGVAYGSDVDKVKKIVLSELKKIKNLESEPAPLVRFIEMADSSLNFKAYFFVNSFENRFSAIDEANTRIYNALRKNKIEIPFPQMDVYIKKFKK